MSENERTDAPGHGAAYDGSGDDDGFQWTQFRHFLHAPLRRPVLVVVPWVTIFLLSIVALFVLPKKYMSTALVLVESEKVPESFIAKVATRDPASRLDAVRPEILSRTRLERVLEETQPYPALGKNQAVDKMRNSIYIYLSGNDGFTITFYHRDPLKAQEVTDRLARLFIDETTKARSQQVEGAVDFLTSQVKDARTELESKDAALRRYKEERMGKLPEQLDANLATMQMLQREMQTVEESLLFAREKQEALARGSGRSPAVARAAAPSAGAGELDDLTRQLAALRTRYKDQHPDVESLRARIARLQARLAEVRQEDGRGSDTAAEPDSSAAVAREQLERAGIEVRALEKRRGDIEAKISSIRANVEETPRTEQELATLTRDYKKLDEKYTALLTKQLDAQMSGRLEQRWKGDRFRMLDPASLPEKPVFPKKTVVVGLGAILGLLVGLGAALGAEYLDPTVKDSEVLQAVQGYPVLASIPHFPELAAVSARPRAAADAPARERERRTEAGETGWGPSLAGEAPLRDEGVVMLRKVVPVIESLEDVNSVVGEEMRFFAANLVETCRRLDVKCLALTSALPGEGKSTLSAGLASAVGREPGRRILLIEADLRRPSLTQTLGLPPAHGLGEWLNGTLDYVPVRWVEPGGFYLISAGEIGLKRPELLGSPRMDAVLKAGRRLFDLVLLDAVPVLPVADTVLMQDLVDGFQLVVRSRKTPRDAIHDTLAKLRADKVIGVVFNGHKEYKASHKYYGYQRYGMAYGPGPTVEPGLFGKLALAFSRAARR